MGWQAVAYVVAMVAAVVLSYALAPRPSQPTQQGRPPAGLDEIDFPTAEAGRDIPVVFGTRWIKGPNVVWYGDLRTSPIQETNCSGGGK